ncbi:hypothetical protein BJ875DRAFT_465135 [Amylocarpus encephaloides]|uniref:Mso1 N-terminal domain-containing protein n=1 Tax=Amylocarpus encephaloides TaxID=45428 RepID=A0A9P8C4D4_9HELO|nr:hypothetical protein BJ875DRAFT_465135 [Amylocarpus encephaloides]
MFLTTLLHTPLAHHCARHANKHLSLVYAARDSTLESHSDSIFAMASYFSFSNLKAKIPYLSSDADGSTQYDTAIARSLKNYYAEKQKPWPATWQNGDPEERKRLDIYDPAAIRPAAPAQAVLVPPSNYGGGPPQSNNSSFRGQQQNQQYQQQAPPSSQSLRNLRPAARSPFEQQSSVKPTPLPSQRGDSYQKNNLNAYGQNNNPTPPSSSGGTMSARDRLKDNFRRPAARSNSPANNSSAPVSRNNSYGASSASTISAGRNYDDDFTPGNYNSRGDKPLVSANSPWSGGDDFSGYGGGGGYEPTPPRQQQPQRMGLPSGPRVRKY